MKKQHSLSKDFPKQDVRLAIKQGIDQAQKELTMSKKPRYKGIIYTLASLAAAIVLLIGSAYVSPTIASSLSQIPIIGSVFKQSDQVNLQIANEQGLSKIVGVTEEVNGISVTVDEVLYDQNNITVGLFIESEESLPEHYFGAGMDMTIDGKLPSYLAWDYHEETLSETSKIGIQQILITDEMPDAFDLGLILTGANNEKWEFSVPIEKLKDMKKVFVNHLQTVGDLTIHVHEITIGQTGVSLHYEGIEKGTDFHNTLGDFVEFHITDQDGREIPSITGGVMGEVKNDEIIFKSHKQFDPIGDAVTELIITPYIMGHIEHGVEIEGDKDPTKYTRKIKGEENIFESFTIPLK